jgi:WD40 repeat protein
MGLSDRRDHSARLIRAALASGGRAGRRVRAARGLAALGTPEAAVGLAEVYRGAADERVRDTAGQALAALTSRAAIDAVCELAISAGDDRLHALLRDAGLAPSDPARRALWLLLAGRFEEAAGLDYDGSLLRAAYRGADAALRGRIAGQARAAGRAEWVRTSAGGLPGAELAQLSDDEWRATTDVLAATGRYEELWRLARGAPLPQAARLLRTLAEHRWQPSAESDREGYAHLAELARRCVMPPGAARLFCDMRVLADQVDQGGEIALNAAGDLLAFAEYQPGRVRLWDLPGGEQLGETHVGRLPAETLAVAPDGALIAVMDYEGALRLLSVPSGGPALTLPTGRYEVSRLAFTPDSTRLAGASIWGRLWVREIPSGRLLWKTRAHSFSSPLRPVFSPDGQLLVTSGRAGLAGGRREQIRLWHVDGGEPAGTIEPSEHVGVAEQVLFTADGQRLVIGWGGSIALYELPSLTLVAEHETHASSHVAVTPDGRHVAIMRDRGGHGEIQLRRTADDELAVGFDGGLDDDYVHAISQLTVAPDGRLLLGADSWDGPVHAWHLPGGEHAGTLPGSTDGGHTLLSAAGGSIVAHTSCGYGERRGRQRDRLLLWTAEPVLAAQIPVGQVPAATAGLLRDQTRKTPDRPWGELLAALVNWRHRHDIEIGAPSGVPATSDIEVSE